jgi:hypothetical protein
LWSEIRCSVAVWKSKIADPANRFIGRSCLACRTPTTASFLDSVPSGSEIHGDYGLANLGDILTNPAQNQDLNRELESLVEEHPVSER